MPSCSRESAEQRKVKVYLTEGSGPFFCLPFPWIPNKSLLRWVFINYLSRTHPTHIRTRSAFFPSPPPPPLVLRSPLCSAAARTALGEAKRRKALFLQLASSGGAVFSRKQREKERGEKVALVLVTSFGWW